MSEKENVSGAGLPNEAESGTPAAMPVGNGGHVPRLSMSAAPAASATSAATLSQRLEVVVESRSGKGISRLVFGIFPDLRKASVAMLALEERGFSPEDITLRLSKENRDVIEGRRVFRDQRGGSYVARAPLALRKERAWKSGLAIGAVIGAAVGALAALFAGPAGAATITIYGLVFLARAVVAWAMVGFASALGGVLGAMYGLMHSQYAARDYESARTLEGAIVGVTVHDDTEADAIERTLRGRGAEIVSSA